MKNVFFPDEEITKDDVFYVCSLIERIARHLKQPNRYVVNCMGKVYMRLVLSTLYSWEDYADAILRIYNDKICRTIDNYNGSAYYEPSYYLTRCYYSGTFN